VSAKGCPPSLAEVFLAKILMPESDSLFQFLGEIAGLARQVARSHDERVAPEKRKRTIEAEIRQLTAALLAANEVCAPEAVIDAINEREVEAKQISARLLECHPNSL
jgi:hypothetical protein